MKIQHLGCIDYQSTLQTMQEFTEQRIENSEDQIWFLEHPSVYTVGKSLAHAPLPIPTQGIASTIPWVRSNRGGKITYHGPGQLVCYLMLQLKRYHLSIRDLVDFIEGRIIDLLMTYDLMATTNRHAPGIYIDGLKIASLGLRISRGYTYHGFSLNVNMDLTPFDHIPVCGDPTLAVANLSRYVPEITMEAVTQVLQTLLCEGLLQRTQE